jgi:hypothetical protein
MQAVTADDEAGGIRVSVFKCRVNSLIALFKRDQLTTPFDGDAMLFSYLDKKAKKLGPGDTHHSEAVFLFQVKREVGRRQGIDVFGDKRAEIKSFGPYAMKIFV